MMDDIETEEFEQEGPPQGQCPCWTTPNEPTLGIYRLRSWQSRPSGEQVCCDCGKPRQIVSIRQPRP
jgi:hypothetical protein